MTLLVIGASKGIGLRTVERATEVGLSVRGLSRGPSDFTHPAYEHIEGDATSPEDLIPALQGCDAVILTLGVPLRQAMKGSGTTLFSDATRALLPAMEAAQVDRLLVVTGIGTGDSKNALSWAERAAQDLMLGGAYADKDRQEAMVRNTALRWTLVRPVVLTDTTPRARGRYKILDGPATWRNGLISRADVADYLVKAISENLHIRQAVVLTL